MKRKIDELGRIVIPKEYRKQLNVNNDTYFEISVQPNQIVLTAMHNTVECKECGTFMTTNDKFCSQCGTKITD